MAKNKQNKQGKQNESIAKANKKSENNKTPASEKQQQLKENNSF